jgi:hypothetical protein
MSGSLSPVACRLSPVARPPYVALGKCRWSGASAVAWAYIVAGPRALNNRDEQRAPIPAKAAAIFQGRTSVATRHAEHDPVARGRHHNVGAPTHQALSFFDPAIIGITAYSRVVGEQKGIEASLRRCAGCKVLFAVDDLEPDIDRRRPGPFTDLRRLRAQRCDLRAAHASGAGESGKRQSEQLEGADQGLGYRTGRLGHDRFLRERPEAVDRSTLCDAGSLPPDEGQLLASPSVVMPTTLGWRPDQNALRAYLSVRQAPKVAPKNPALQSSRFSPGGRCASLINVAEGPPGSFQMVVPPVSGLWPDAFDSGRDARCAMRDAR